MDNETIEKPDFHIPDLEEFRKGYAVYNEKEKKRFVYFEALSLVTKDWGDPQLMARGVQKLIRSWNRFYANFSLPELAFCIEKNIDVLESYRKKKIFDLSEVENENISSLFRTFLLALKRENDGALSAVSVAKAFGILTPTFLPIWDSQIAFRYDCPYLSDMAESSYLRICKKMKVLAEKVQHFVPCLDDRALLKRIDEYNYSKYTMHWI